MTSQLPPPLIISTPRPLIAALHQAPDGSGCVREEGRCNSQVWRRVMRHTWSEWSLITAAVICRLRLSSGDRSLPRACTLVSSWVQEGSVEGRVPPKARAAEPTRVRTRAAPARRPSGQDAGRLDPSSAAVDLEVDEAAGKSRRPSRPGPRRGARAAAGLRPLPGPFLPEHCPSFTHPRSTTRTPDSPLLFWTLYSPWTLLLYYFCLIKASPRPDATPTVSVVCSSRHTGGECGQAEPRQRSWETPMTSSPLARRSSWKPALGRRNDGDGLPAT